MGTSMALHLWDCRGTMVTQTCATLHRQGRIMTDQPARPVQSVRICRKMCTSMALHLWDCRGSSCATPHRQGSSTDPHSTGDVRPI